MDNNILHNSKLVKAVRQSMSSKLNEDKQWDIKSHSKKILDLSQLSYIFPARNALTGVREITLEKRIGGEFVGYAAAYEGNYENDPIKEYAYVVLCDDNRYEAYTFKGNTDVTYVLMNGKELGKYICVKRSMVFRLCNNRLMWELWKGNSLFGTVETGCYLFINKIKLISFVKWDSLYIKRKDLPALPVHIDCKDNLTDFFWLYSIL